MDTDAPGWDAWTALDADATRTPARTRTWTRPSLAGTHGRAWTPMPTRIWTPSAQIWMLIDPDVELPGAPDDEAPAPADSDSPTSSATTTVPSGSGQVTVVPGVPRYHEENCILTRFMADEGVERMTVPEAEKAGCTPCSACQPED